MGSGHGHGGHGGGAAAITVAAGGTAEWRDTAPDAGELLIGCHQPGLYDAGMVASIDIRDRSDR
jgi:uncharacterized cupredoxin-like copper-binding protein